MGWPTKLLKVETLNAPNEISFDIHITCDVLCHHCNPQVTRKARTVMKAKSKILQVPMDAALSAKWDSVCVDGKNVYSNNAGVLDRLIDAYAARKADANMLAFTLAVMHAVRLHGWDLQLHPIMAHKFKVEAGSLWRNTFDREATKEHGTDVYTWVRIE